jgi:hypothetical protein
MIRAVGNIVTFTLCDGVGLGVHGWADAWLKLKGMSIAVYVR